jgi:hypothetical protein
MALNSGNKSLRLVVAVFDADVDPGERSLSLGLEVQPYEPIEVGLRDALVSVLTSEINSKVRSYIDKDRFLKTLVNFGEDTQRIVTNWKLDPNDNTKLLVKLLSPLDFDLDVGNRVFISREVADSVVDTVKLELIPQPDTSLWLRPKNTEVKSFISDTELLNIYGRRVANQTLSSIGIDVTGSEDQYGGYSFQNNILRKWFTDDYKSVELNIDYSDYANFVTYGSAKLRLDAFKQKITKIAELEGKSRFYATGQSGSIFGQFETLISTPTTIFSDTALPSPVLISDSGSLLVTTGSTVTIFSVEAIPSAALYLVEGAKQAALDIENIIRSFDGYERYLFYNSGSAYSASAYWQLNDTEYNPDGTWPKKNQNGDLYAPTSQEVTYWYELQSAIAQRYDDNNVNLLSNAIPQYLQDDLSSQDFIKFTNMIGHFFDAIKVYIDQLPLIYDRKVNATEGLSQDLVWNVAKSFGLSLTNPDSAVSLYSFTTDGNTVKKREQVTELYKRFLHNAPYLNRTRGTANSLKALLGIFGLNEQVIGIRETDTTTTGSFEIFDEVTNALNFNSGSYLVLPMTGSSQRETYTLQFRFNNATDATTTLGVGDTGAPSGSWVVDLVTHPSASNGSTFGRIEIKDTIGEVLLSSSYADMFDNEDYYDVMIRYDGPTVTLNVAQADGEEILYSSSMSTTASYMIDAWNATQNFYLGGSGSLSTNTFNGYVDEVRIWGEKITDQRFYEQVLDPGSFVGNSYTSPVENLWVRLSFHTPRNLWLGSTPNDSPYRNKDGGSDPLLPLLPNITNVIAVGFENKTAYPYSMTRVSRKIKQYTTNNGAYSYGSNKIIIAPPPVFTEVGAGGEKILHRTKSIVDNEARRQQQQSKKYLGFFVSPTDAVNNLLIRSLGNIDVKALVGINTRYESKYSEIERLQNYYKQYYNATVNIPQFVRFFDQLAPTLFEQASQLVPAKTILASGIVIEPNILEHKKLVFEKPVKLSGENTRRNSRATSTDGTYNRDFDITLSTGTTINIRGRESQSAFYTDYNTKLNLTEQSTVRGDSNSYYTTTLEMMRESGSGENATYDANTLFLTSSMPEAEINTGLLNGVTIEHGGGIPVADYYYYEGDGFETIDNNGSLQTTYEVFDSDVDKLSYINYLQTYAGMSADEARGAAVGYKPGNIIDINELIGLDDRLTYASLINVIPPRADLEDYGVVNYFIKDNAIYNFETVRKEIIGTKQLNFLSGTAATWSFGQTYNRNDVVVQYGATGSAKTSNGKLFRYIASDSPSVSYNFPSQDQNRWAPIFYRGQAVQSPFRIIFDTNKLQGDESVYTLPTTRVNIARPTVAPSRYTTRLAFRTFLPNGRETGIIRLQAIASLLSVGVGVGDTPTPNIRVRLYDTAANRTADLNRAFGVEPTGDHGVLLDMQFGAGSVGKNIGLYPPATLVNNDIGQASSPNIYYTIEELNGVTYSAGFIVTFRYFAIEAPIELPIGYLPRHYKFYRDTLLATRRRNFEGCKNTVDTTIDGRTPVEVTFTAGTTITVSPNILQEEDNLGGINLNVN